MKKYFSDVWKILIAWRNNRPFPKLEIDHDAPIEGAIDINDTGSCDDACWNREPDVVIGASDEALHAYCWKNVKSLDPIKVSAASLMLYDKFVESGVLKDLIERITENRTGWLHGRDGELGGLHFGFGMQVRNTLRRAGFGEAYFGIDNLDDFYTPLVELACGFQAPGCKACPDCG